MSKRYLAIAVPIGLVMLASGARRAHAEPWCRLDDPAAFIAARARLPIDKQGDVASVQCTPVADAQTIPEEISLPMPCGRFMLFRRVTIPMSHALDQQIGYFGRDRSGDDADNPLDDIQQGPWVGHVAGSFTIPGKTTGQRAYYIGKYPVAAHQARLSQNGLMAPDGGRLGTQDPACKAYADTLVAIRERNVLPATNFSWFDAVAFAQSYTEWLLSIDAARRQAGTPPYLPWEHGDSGFIRLPTEPEWEFAARGGEATADRQNQPFYRVRDPADGRIREARSKEEIAQTTSRDGKPVGIGGKLPNLLGLFDTVGNQGQIVFDMFRPVRPDATFQASPGGFVVRGGSVRGTMGIADRKERESFVDGKPNRGDPTVGFRLVITAPVVVSDGDWRQQRATSNDVEAGLRAARKALLSVTALPDAAPRHTLDADLGALDRANADLAAATRRGESEAERARSLEREVDQARQRIAELNQAAAAAASARSQAETARAQMQQDEAARALASLERQLKDQTARNAELKRQSDEKIAQSVSATQSRVVEMRQALERSTATLNQTQAELADELVFTAVTLAKNAFDLGRINYTAKRGYLPLIPKMRASPDSTFSNPATHQSLDQLLDAVNQSIPSVESSIEATFAQYVNTVFRLARFPRATIDTAFARADERLRTPQGASSETLQIVQRHVIQSIGAGAAASQRIRQNWLDEIDATRKIRLRP